MSSDAAGMIGAARGGRCGRGAVLAAAAAAGAPGGAEVGAVWAHAAADKAKAPATPNANFFILSSRSFLFSATPAAPPHGGAFRRITLPVSRPLIVIVIATRWAAASLRSRILG
jgi:hypothetical protein